jgi:hypothetical protein
MKNAMLIPALLACAAGSALAQVPTEWTFKIVAREPHTGQGLGLPTGAELVQNDPGLDNDGSACVRFTANGGDGIFVYDAATDTGQVVLFNPASAYFSSIDMLNGRIALTRDTGGVEIRDKAGTLLYTFPLGGNEGITGSINRVRLTSTGDVGYRGASGGITKIVVDRYVDSTRVQTALASTASYSFLYSPTINNAYQMAAKADPPTGGNAVVRWQEGQAPVTILATQGSPYNLISNGTDLNDAGEVAFFVRTSADGRFHLLKSAGGPLTTIASALGPEGISNTNFANFPPVINNNGLVAFRPESGGNRIYIGDGNTLVPVIGDGDMIATPDGGFTFLGAGSPRTAIVGNIALNDANQIAFIARLADGSDALVIATPVGGGPSCGTADFDGDGDVGTDADIEAFFACLAGNCCASCWHLGADFDGDGDSGTDADIEAFFRVLAGGEC